MEFRFGDYAEAVTRALGRFDHVCAARDYLALPETERRQANVLFLRHDCERDLTKALTLARIEHEKGVTATYFVRVHSEYYNPLLQPERRILREISGFGHEIGLHYEPRFYTDEGLDLLDAIDADRALLEAIPGIGPVTALSAHQPLLSPPDFATIAARGLTEVYIHPEFREMRYYSDSGMSWREKTLAEAVESERRCQFLIHPDFWNETPLDWFDNLDARRNAVVADLDTTVEAEKQMLRDYLARRDQRDAEFGKLLGKS